MEQYILNIIDELFYKFDIDGITLDFTRNPVLFGSEINDKEKRISILNDFMREVKKIVPDSKKINVRFPYNIEDYDMDIKTWIEEGLVQSISPSVLKYEDYFDIKPFVGMVKNTDVKLFISITSNTDGEDLSVKTEKLFKTLGSNAVNNKYLSVSDYLKRAYECYKNGADGVLLFNINCQIGEDYKLPTKLSILNSTSALKKWYLFEYASVIKTKYIEIIKPIQSKDSQKHSSSKSYQRQHMYKSSLLIE